MTTRVPAVEDCDAIYASLIRREAERLRGLSCTCRPSDDGTEVDSAACPVHRAPPGEQAAFAPPEPRPPWTACLAVTGDLGAAMPSLSQAIAPTQRRRLLARLRLRVEEGR